MIGLLVAAMVIVGGGLLWCRLVPSESDRFAWVFWGWVLLIGVNAIGFGLELLGFRF